MTNPLATSARIVAELRERLTAEHGLQDGEEAMEDTLEGASDLPELLARMARMALMEEAASEAIDTYIDALTHRYMRRKAKAKTLRAQIAWALQEAGWKRIPDDACPDMTVSVRQGNAPLTIENESLLSDDFVTVKTVRTPDKKLIRQYLEDGGLLDGARLGNPMPVLTIRVK